MLWHWKCYALNSRKLRTLTSVSLNTSIISHIGLHVYKQWLKASQVLHGIIGGQGFGVREVLGSNLEGRLSRLEWDMLEIPCLVCHSFFCFRLCCHFMTNKNSPGGPVFHKDVRMLSLYVRFSRINATRSVTRCNARQRNPKQCNSS